MVIGVLVFVSMLLCGMLAWLYPTLRNSHTFPISSVNIPPVY